MDLEEILEIGKMMKELDLDMIFWAVAVLKGGIGPSRSWWAKGFWLGIKGFDGKNDQIFLEMC